MKVVVADATPLHYLILVHAIDILPRLFQRISTPFEVREELTRPASPPLVRSWIEDPPPWLDIVTVEMTNVGDPALAELDPGERAAILLAERNHADLLLIDERAGAAAALQRGLTITGTLGLLDLASQAAYLDLKSVFGLLQKTNFRYPPSLMETLLEQDKNRRE
jgi:predicted nucleic acid-binding protein